MGADHPLNVAYTLLSWLLGLDVDGLSLLLYAALLSLFVGIGAIYYELILHYLAPPRVISMSRQALGLTLLALGLFGASFASVALTVRDETLDQWWQTGGPIMLLGGALGTVVYALTAVYGRALAIAAIPVLRRSPPQR